MSEEEEAVIDNLQPDAKAAVLFLQNFSRDGDVLLTTIHPNTADVSNKIYSSVANQSALEGAIKFANKDRGIYFGVNEFRPLAKGKKGKEDQVAAVRAIHVDIDYDHSDHPYFSLGLDEAKRRGLEDLKSYEPAPSVIVDSGGGYHAYWMLETPIPLASADLVKSFRERNYAVAQHFHADACHNLDRIMRMPFTVNWPNAKKRARGRVPVLSFVVKDDWKLRYRPDQFARVEIPSAETSPKGDAPADETIQRPKTAHAPELEAAILAGHYDNVTDNNFDRSAQVWRVVCELLRCGDTVEEIVKIITDPKNGISAHVLQSAGARGPENYARRTINRASLLVNNPANPPYLDHNGNPRTDNVANLRWYLIKQRIDVAYNEFNLKYYLDGFGRPDNRGDVTFSSNAHSVDIMAMIEAKYGVPAGKWSKNFVMDAIKSFGRENTYHPLKLALEEFKWDGVPRVEKLFIDYGGAEDTPYVRAVAKLFMVAAIRRVYEPGCKFDSLVIIEGPQGANKSGALKALAIDEVFFTDEITLEATSKEVQEQTCGKWIVEIAELVGGKREANALKAMLSRQADRARAAYAYEAEDIARAFVFAATTNERAYLLDQTGSRRFLPVKTPLWDLKKLRLDVQQLWAEAMVLERDYGEDLVLPTSLWETAKDEQFGREIGNVFMTVVQKVFGDMRGRITDADVYAACGLSIAQAIPVTSKTQIHEAMLATGWSWSKRSILFPGANASKQVPVFIRAAEGDGIKHWYQIESVMNDNGRFLRLDTYFVKDGKRGAPLADGEQPAY